MLIPPHHDPVRRGESVRLSGLESSYPESVPDKERTTLERLLPRLEERFASQIEPHAWENYLRRLHVHFSALFRHLYALYGHQYDFFFHIASIVVSMTQMWLERSDELKALDTLRETDPHWYQSNRLVGAMCYVDLFAGDLVGLRSKIPYLTELGITYLHLMPLFKAPPGENDGGYAVSSYREVAPELGTMSDLNDLAAELRHRGISLCVDFVFNHTSDEHEWARKALAGNVEYQNYYRMYADRSMPDAYEETLGEIFPEEHPGAFTYRSRIGKWVWTTFHNYQWDLNYENPVVFNRMLEEMLFLANQGVEILRLDAVAFLWKALGTSCQNLPQAHWIIRAFNAVTRIAAPATVLKSEAIVHPDEVRKYVGEDECQLSYNPQLMALLWNSLATRDIKVMQHGLRNRFYIPRSCDWVNYVRCHDDIGWAFSDDDVMAGGFSPHDHRRFLTDFFTARFPGSFAKGRPFQENVTTGDARVSGTNASLAGLEHALDLQDEREIELAIRKILLLHGVILTIGGIPLIYLGDELATLNDYNYERDPEKFGDSRWLHRPPFDWERAEQRHELQTVTGRVYQGILRLIQLRKQNLAFSRAETEIIDTGNDSVFAYFRHHEDHSALVLANFSEREQTIAGRHLRLLGLRRTGVDLVAGQTVTASQELRVEPYQFMVLAQPR